MIKIMIINILSTLPFVFAFGGCERESISRVEGKSAYYFNEIEMSRKEFTDYKNFLVEIGIGKKALPRDKFMRSVVRDRSGAEILRTDPLSAAFSKRPKFFVCNNNTRAFALYPSIVYASDIKSTFGIIHFDMSKNKIWFEEKIVPAGFEFMGKIKHSTFNKYFIAELRNRKSTRLTDDKLTEKIDKKYLIKSFDADDIYNTDLTPNDDIDDIWRKFPFLKLKLMVFEKEK